MRLPPLLIERRNVSGVIAPFNRVELKSATVYQVFAAVGIIVWRSFAVVPVSSCGS
jgi:hypothetical protein